MLNLFRRKKVSDTTIVSPAPGELMALADVPDPVFAGGVMGPGFAVELDSDDVCSPVSGEVILLAETFHAFAVRSADGAEVLVHIGVDTVRLRGQGFSALRSVGDKVAAGDIVVRVARNDVRGLVPSLISPVVVTNADEFEPFEPVLTATAGEAVVTLARR